nr:M2 family metallopeptidase [Sphingorhabdus sp.]
MRLSRKSAAKSVGKTAASIIALAAITLAAPAYAQTGSSQNSEATPTAEDAKKFVAETEKKMFDYSVDASRVYWINSTYITDDTDALAAKAGAEGTTMAVQAAIDAAKYKDVQG